MPASIGQPGADPTGLSPSEFAKLFALQPEEAVTYLQRRGALKETFDWRDLWQDEHATQFTVSRLTRLDILKTIQEGIGKSVDGDLSRRDWTRDIKALLVKEGWWGEKEVLDPVTGKLVKTVFDPARLKLIYDTNTNMAYSAGLWERIQRNKATSPYLRYITKRDERVRVTHQAWDNVTLPVDHPFWDTHYPPNGWRCRCRAMSMSQAQYDDWKAKRRIKTEAPPIETRRWVDKRSGEIHQIPVGIDPGFAYNVGQVNLAKKGELLLSKAIDADPRTAAVAIKEALKNTRLMTAVADDFETFSRKWVDEVATAEAMKAAGKMYAIKTTGETHHIGALSYETWMALWRKNMAPESAIISVRDIDVVHAFRSTKKHTLPVDWYARLPERLAQADAVILDATHKEGPAILLLFNQPGTTGKLVVRIDYATKRHGKMNIVETGRVFDANDIASVRGQIGQGYELLEGSL